MAVQRARRLVENEDARVLEQRARDRDSLALAAGEPIAAVANDRYSIGFNFMKIVKMNPGVKPLGLAVRDNGPYIPPTRETFRQRTYPLVTGLYIYLNRPPGKLLAPRLKEFLTFVLSREGQQAIVDDGMYIPLTAEEAREQLKKLN